MNKQHVLNILYKYLIHNIYIYALQENKNINYLLIIKVP